MCALLSLALVGCQSLTPGGKSEGPRPWDAQRAALKSDLARKELEQGRTEQAAALAREAVALTPDNPSHIELLARTYLARADFSAARQVLELARQTHPNEAELAYLLGTVFEHEQNWDAAIVEFRRAVQHAPTIIDYVVALAHALAQAGQLPAAIRELSAVKPRFASEPAYFSNLAELYRQAGEPEKAIAAYRNGLRLGTDDVQTRAALAQALYRLGRCDEALDLLEALVSRDGSPAENVLRAYAGCLLNTGQARRAVDWLVRGTNQRPESAALWLLLAEAFGATGDVQSALNAARKAVSLTPRSVDAFVVLAGVHLRADDVVAAEQAVRKALALSPTSVEALLLHGRICEKRGDAAGAATAYRAALANDPQNELARQLLARLSAMNTP